MAGRWLAMLLVIGVVVAMVLGQTCPNNGQKVVAAAVNGAAATYTGADVVLGEVNNFSFTTSNDTAATVFTVSLAVSEDIALCPLYPLIFQVDSCPCDSAARCDGHLVVDSPAVTAGVYKGAQSLFTSANSAEQLYPMQPLTTYFVAFWLIDGCPVSASSSLSFSVSSAPIESGTAGVVEQDLPFLESASGSVEAIAFLSVPTTGVPTTTVDGLKVTVAPTSVEDDEDDFLDCVFVSDQEAPLVASDWWTTETCNADYDRNAFSFVVDLPGNMPAVPNVAIDLALSARVAGTYNVTYEFSYSCGDCGPNSICMSSSGLCGCAPGWAFDYDLGNCTIPIDCQGNTTVPCYIEDGTAEKTCVNSVWGPCTLIACDSGYVETAWGNSTTNSTQCIAETVKGPGLTILWICLGIVLLYAIYGAIGAAVYFYQRHKRLGTAVKSYDNDEYESTVF